MDNVARLSDAERSALFSETAAEMNTTPAVVEKDFWVTWVLHRLFGHPELGAVLMFKGGTSLSKVYGLIERFSEDIDLVIDWRLLTGEDPFAARSTTQQRRLNEAINDEARRYIGAELLPRVAEALDGVVVCALEPDNPHVINARYPAAFSDTYVRPELRLEIGPLASWLPHEERNVSCYAAEAFPDVFATKECCVNVIRAERTFWEKATILHHEAHRPEGNPQPLRYSRHYYDLARMAGAPVKDVALANLELLTDVVEFKQRFYPRSWARYDLARPGTMRLVPEGEVLRSVEVDYRAMAHMIFGEVPEFGNIMTVLQELEGEINA